MTARSGDVGRPQPIRSPSFVGRQAELAALAEALHGPRAVVLIEGESGIGKSRLLREFLAGATACGLGALLAVCPPFREPFTLGPVVDALRQATDSVQGLTLSPLAGALRPLFPEWAAQLPPALEPAEDATAARHRLFRAIVELLDCLRVRTLIVEDVHWADEATLEFLLFLATSNSQERSLVVTYRLEDVPDGSLLLRLSSRLPIGTAQLRLALAPLDVTDTEALVASMFPGSQVSREFAEFVHEHTDGVPLAVEESLRLMHERADLTRRDGAWVRRRLHEIAVPPTVRDAVLERAGRLGPDAQAVLHAAAVLSDPTDETTLLAI
ncbi:MAG TPA: AAA family ATPase, partial [Jatrophihabitans sp.]|nr:AAA family ATPase [Jatrophihabitans sp.]